MIRKINKEDKELFLKLTTSFYKSDAVLEPIPEKYHHATFEELTRSDNYLEGFILEFNDCVAGYALLSKTFSQEAGGIVVWLEELYILDSYQGKGLGSEFLEYLEKNVPAAKYRLEVEKDNKRAISLYNKTGYKVYPYVQLIKSS